jgi:hypothetical protein
MFCTILSQKAASFLQLIISGVIIKLEPMKQILLLAAIYSLIIHQSNKNAKEKEMAAKKTIPKTISLQINSDKKSIVSPISAYVNTNYLSGGNNNHVYSKWDNKE